MYRKGQVVRFTYGRSDVQGTLDQATPTGVMVEVSHGTIFVPFRDILSIREVLVVPVNVTPIAGQTVFVDGAWKATMECLMGTEYARVDIETIGRRMIALSRITIAGNA